MQFLVYLFRWGHFLAGITWIGLLYYFNFVQTPYFAEAEAAHRSGAVQKLVPRALWWFRWAAFATFVFGVLLYVGDIHTYGSWAALMAGPNGWGITAGALMGTIMMMNVWGIIWRNQKVVIASAIQVAQGGQAIPEAAAKGKWAGYASRTNVVFSIPMLFFMEAGSHMQTWFTGQVTDNGKLIFGLVGAVIIALVELNALTGEDNFGKKPLATVSGALTFGFILTAIFLGLLYVAFPATA